MVNMEERLGKAYVVDLRYRNRAFIECLENILLSAKKLIAWNTKFDLHMTYNVGMEKLIKHPGLTDAMIYARLANAALTSKNGGVNLKLKPYSVKYLDSDAQYYEKKVAEAKKELKIKRNKILKDMGVKVGELNEFLKDKINTVEVKKLETSANMFKQMANFSSSIKGNFEKLAETLAEDLMPILQELKEIMGQVPEKLDTGFQNTSASIAATTYAPTTANVTEQVNRENPNLTKEEVETIVKTRLNEKAKSDANSTMSKLDELISLLKGYSGDNVIVKTV
jgi:cytochrome c556